MKIFKLNSDNKDIVFRLGDNAKENHQLIDDADPNDWWFHLDNYPSSHCIVETNELNNQLTIYAAQLVKEYSKYKNHKNLRFLPSRTGTGTVRDNKNLKFFMVFYKCVQIEIFFFIVFQR